MYPKELRNEVFIGAGGDEITSVYFIGAGGIGMSALIRFFQAKGKKIAGYDRTPSPLTEQLEKEGVDIHFTDDVSLIPDDFLDKNKTFVIYTPAVPSSHQELNYFKNNGFQVLKRSSMLAVITSNLISLCIAGTHGKTTTSSMLAHLLKQSNEDCNAFLGGILKNYNSNMLYSGFSEFVVVEADEYDRSFHSLKPVMAVITAVDPDHLDIYGTPQDYRESFEKFTSLIQPGGVLLMKKGIDIKPIIHESVWVYTYSATDESADFYASNIHIGKGRITFDFIINSNTRFKYQSNPLIIPNIRLGVPVRTNIENALAAMALAFICDVSPKEIRAAIASFQGVVRRFDIRFKNRKAVYIDDYAHHPEELKSSILSIKELYGKRKVTGIFQPHLYSRTKDFADEMAEALSLLDRLILLDIYPAREEPIPGVTSELIFDKVTMENKTLCKKEDLLQLLEKEKIDVLVTLGAGDIDRLVEPIRLMLNKKYGKK